MDNRTDRLELEFAALAEQVNGRYFGKYRGLVESVDDPEKQGFITCRVPSVYKGEISPPCLPAVPFAGPNYGVLWLPQKGDGVWVEFEDGNPNLPIWTGFWWARREQPTDGSAKKRVIVTPAGLKVILDDDKGSISLQNKTAAEITMTGSEITLRVAQTKVVIDAAGFSVNGLNFKVAR
jgi:hypothetical protein